MKNREITANQAMFSLILFNFGSSLVFGINAEVLQDTMIAMFIATAAAIPLYCVYARIMTLFPQKSMFEVMELLFGRVGGKILVALATWYCIHLGALVLRNFSEFTQVSSMPETPQLVIITIMGLTAVYLARSSIRTIGKWSVIVFFLVVIVVFITVVTSIDQANIDHLFPLFAHPMGKIMKTAFMIFSFPYAEVVVFFGISGAFPKDKPLRILLWALLVVFIFFMLVFVRNLVVLGPKITEISFFPSYIAARLIDLSNFMARIEALIASNFLLAGIVKTGVCLLAAAKGICVIFNLNNDKLMVLPAGILAMGLCAIMYENLMQMFGFLDYYPYYAFPFQVLIPVSVWIAGEIYKRKQQDEMLAEENP